MSIESRTANRLTKRIKKYQKYVDKVSVWIRRDKKDLKKVIKGLSKEEHLEYKYSCGDIEKADNLVIKQKMEERK